MLDRPLAASLVATYPVNTQEQHQIVAQVLREISAAFPIAEQPDDLWGLILSLASVTTGYVIAEVVRSVENTGGVSSELIMRKALAQSEGISVLFAPFTGSGDTWSMEREFYRALDALLNGWDKG